MSLSTEIGPPERYQEGEDRYIHFIEDFLGVELADIQKRMLRAVATNQRTLLEGANGPGKSFVTAGLKLAFLYENTDSIVLGTSGSYQQYHDTMWRPLEGMHSHAKRVHGLPGETKGGEKGASLELDNEWYAKTVSPRSPGELEGRHGSDVLIVIDEADKKYVTEEHFDSAGSSITDLNDKMVAICNPPEDESNVVYQIETDPRWEVIKFSSFEAHNVLIDAGEIDAEPIPGIVDLVTIASDWEAWNGEPWPGVDESYRGEWPGMPTIQNLLEENKIERDRVIEWLRPGYHTAKDAHRNRTDLDSRWYRRRAGVIPPDTASAHRPIYADQVQAARSQSLSFGTNRYAIGIDIGRTGDSTAVVEVRKLEGMDQVGMYVRADESGTRDHGDNESICRAAMENGPLFGPCAIDAMGEGSGVADQISREYEAAIRFDAGMNPVSPDRQKEYKNRRTEALYLLGKFLDEGGRICSTRLEEELFAAARHIQYQRRRSKGRDVLAATPKKNLKEALGRSPDVLDAAAIAAWCYDGAHDRSIREVGQNQRQTISSTW